MKWTGVMEIPSVVSAVTQRPFRCSMPGTGKRNGQRRCVIWWSVRQALTLSLKPEKVTTLSDLNFSDPTFPPHLPVCQDVHGISKTSQRQGTPWDRVDEGGFYSDSYKSW